MTEFTREQAVQMAKEAAVGHPEYSINVPEPTADDAAMITRLVNLAAAQARADLLKQIGEPVAWVDSYEIESLKAGSGMEPTISKEKYERDSPLYQLPKEPS